MQAKLPLVSVVIPTIGRSPWLGDAVRSVLQQTYSNLEVIVVDDSPYGIDSGLWSLHRPRVRVVRTGGVGGSSARNAGVRLANGEWIAFLDDDDEWRPEKVWLQMHAALRSSYRSPVLASRVLVRTPESDFIFPRKLYDGAERVEEYLFCRDGLTSGGGFLQTSTLLARRSLLLQRPFTSGLRIHQDWDWLLNVSRRRDVSIVMLAEPLAIYRAEDRRESVSRVADWRASLEWIGAQKDWISPRTLSWFVAVQCVWKARASRVGPRDWLLLLKAYCCLGRPSWAASVHFLSFALVPPRWRKSLRNRVWGKRGALQSNLKTSPVLS